MTDLDVRRPDRLPYELGDRYRTGSGPVVLTGVQAIARALVEQHERDARAGLRVATFVSGYQGSPLGGVDKMLAGMPEVLHEARHHLRARAERGTGGDLGVGQPGRPARRHADRTTASSASGTARAPDWTARPTPCGTPTCTASTRAAACCSWSATTRPPSRPPCPRVSERIAGRPRHAGALPAQRRRDRHDGHARGRDVAGIGMCGGAEDRRRRRRRRLVRRRRRRRRRHRRPASAVGGTAVRLPAAADGSAGRPASIAEADLVRAAVGDGARLRCRQRPRRRSRSTRRTRRSGSPQPGTTFDSVRQALADLGVDDFALPPGRYPAAAHRHALPRWDPTRCSRSPTASSRSSSSRTRPRSSRPRCAKSSTAAPVHRGSSARRTPTGRPLIPAGGELTAGRLLAPLRRVLGDRLELKKPPPPALSLEVLPAKRRRVLLLAAARTTGRPRCPRARSPAAESAATPW